MHIYDSWKLLLTRKTKTAVSQFFNLVGNFFWQIWSPVAREKKGCEANAKWKDGCKSCTCQADGKEVICSDLGCRDGNSKSNDYAGSTTPTPTTTTTTTITTSQKA